jgi:hypothetical protein
MSAHWELCEERVLLQRLERPPLVGGFPSARSDECRDLARGGRPDP